jgi:DNA/RNA endonuclease YhcR with UshA esterase domain
MRKYAFILAIVGISVLLGMLILSPMEISNVEELKNLEINSKVSIIGNVEDERNFGDFKILKVRGVELVCDCVNSYLGKELEIVGLVAVFEGEKQIRVLRLDMLD